MKIEKGKLYLYAGELEKCMSDGVVDDGLYSDKIAVHCPTKEDIAYIERHLELKGAVLKWAEIYNHNICVSLDDKDWFLKGCAKHTVKKYHIITIDQFKEFYPEQCTESSSITGKTEENVQNTQPHYDNTHGSLYKIAEQRGWNSYQFDIVKRIDRALKKGQFKEDLQKTKDLIDLWLREESN